MKDYSTDNQVIIELRYNMVAFGTICLNLDERIEDQNITQSFSPKALPDNLILIWLFVKRYKD